MYLDRALLLSAFVTIVSVIIIGGMYGYAGTILPSGRDASPTGFVLMWITWTILATAPFITVVLLLLRWKRKKDQ